MQKKLISKKKSVAPALRPQQKFDYFDVKGDGNCLFRAISVCLFDTEKQHRVLRQEACEQIQKNEEFFKPQIHQKLLENKIASSNQLLSIKNDVSLLDQYVQVMSINKVFGGQLELQAIAQLKNLKIILYGLRPNKPISINDKGLQLIHLKFQKNDKCKDGHYMAMKFASNE